jgi:murein L,D-transpeptidase YcbB/YkuD
MHDTQTKSLFKRKKRAFSHGCMRLSQPQKLLKKVGVEYAGTSMALIEKHKNNSKVSYINLQRTIPVHIVYQTAYVDGGSLKFFEDIYGLDARMKVRQ